MEKLEQICEILGTEVEYDDEMPEKLEGLYIGDELGDLFSINTRCANKEFVLAHELGHFILHQGYDLMATTKSERVKAERAADGFAYGLLSFMGGITA